MTPTLPPGSAPNSTHRLSEGFFPAGGEIAPDSVGFVTFGRDLVCWAREPTPVALATIRITSVAHVLGLLLTIVYLRAKRRTIETRGQAGLAVSSRGQS